MLYNGVGKTGDKNMIIGVVSVVGGVVVFIGAAGYGMVRVAEASVSAFDTYANEDDSEIEEDEDDEG